MKITVFVTGNISTASDPGMQALCSSCRNSFVAKRNTRAHITYKITGCLRQAV